LTGREESEDERETVGGKALKLKLHWGTFF